MSKNFPEISSTLLRLPRPVKTRLYHPYFYKQGSAKNILIFSSRRGGSTLLEQIISSNRGFRTIDQPFDQFFPHTAAGKIKMKYLPKKYLSQFITLNDAEAQDTKHYMDLALSGKLRLLGGIEQWDFPNLGNRTLMKILNASPLIDWFSDTFDVHVCYLIRHPVPQALSVMKNNWGITAEAYIRDKRFVDNYLSLKQLEFSEKVINGDNYFQKAILNWILENLIPLRFSSTKYMKVAYERLVTTPDKVIPLLSSSLSLEDSRAMQKSVLQPSRSAKFSSGLNRSQLKEKNQAAIITGWVNKIDHEQKKYVDTALDLFEISLYRAEKFMPQEELSSLFKAME